MIIKIIIVTGIIIVLFIIIKKIYKKFIELNKELYKVNSQLKSAYVRFGKSFEHFVPFTKKFKGNLEKTVFLGMPIDFICFDEDKIKFIEVKTGKAKLSQKQNLLKNKLKKEKLNFWR